MIGQKLLEEQKTDVLIGQLASFISDNRHNTQLMSKTENIKESFSRTHGVEVKHRFVIKVLKEELQMRYNKIVKVSIHANSKLSIILRQQCAVQLFELFKTKRTFYNID